MAEMEGEAAMTGRTERRGQALMELAVGMFTLALLVSALVVFTQYIARSLDIQNHLRGSSHGVADKIELEGFAADTVFGSRNLHIKEPFGNVNRAIP